MSLSRETRSALRKDPAVRRIIAEWRRLTGGARVADGERGTLLACSGGADSSALVLAIAASVAAKPKGQSKSKASNAATLTVAHIVHDMRTRMEAEADRDASEKLAKECGLPFVEASIRVKGSKGNVEANARKGRYEALGLLAAEAGAKYVATAHHADDQAETFLMRLFRGAGPEGLRGLLPIRSISMKHRGEIVRPMLGVERTDAERICGIAGWKWCEDRTNREVARLRAAVRHELLPIIRRISPRAVRRIGVTSGLMRDVSCAANGEIAQLLNAPRAKQGEISVTRAELRKRSAFTVGLFLRMCAEELQMWKNVDRMLRKPGTEEVLVQKDRMAWKHLSPILLAIHDHETQKRVFRLAEFTVTVGKDV